MLADASDECLVLTRFFDEGIFELGNMSVELLGCKQRINALFGQAEACLQTGFTSLALKHLEKPKMLRTGDGQYKSIGGLPPADIIRIARSECLPRMRAWTRLVQEVADTELPEFELLGAFSALR